MLSDPSKPVSVLGIDKSSKEAGMLRLTHLSIGVHFSITMSLEYSHAFSSSKIVLFTCSWPQPSSPVAEQ